MPDWEKIQEEKHQDILIGRCENQALEMLKTYDFNSEEIKKKYKDLVKMFYKLNMQVEAEILRPSVHIYKPCPKCKEQLPVSWKRHDLCGWKSN